MSGYFSIVGFLVGTVRIRLIGPFFVILSDRHLLLLDTSDLAVEFHQHLGNVRILSQHFHSELLGFDLLQSQLFS